MFSTSNGNHRLKSAVENAYLCVEERGLVCLHVKMKPDSFIKRGKICATEKQNGPQLRFVKHTFAQEAQRKHKIRLQLYRRQNESGIKLRHS